MNTGQMPPLPLVGRDSELSLLHSLLDDADAGRGRMLLLAGESGLGKSRLAKSAADEATRRGWSVAVGRAYPVETGVPYAPISDAFLPLLRSMSPDALAVLTRGGEAELLSLFPTLRTGDTARAPAPETPELKARLLWTFTQLLARLAARRPLLLVIEDLQWADASSLETLHFIARQVGGERIAMLCTYNEAFRDQNAMLRRTEQSLVSMQVATVHRVEALTREETDQLVRDAFGADASAAQEFTALLFGWTRGNPFFIEETLKSLVQSGHLRQTDGRWLGWEVDRIQLPRSIRDAVLERINRLSEAARALAEKHAVIGTSATYRTLCIVSGVDEEEVVEALDELRREQIVVERLSGEALVYDFSHPLLRETLYTELGLARTRLLHASVAETLERHYGPAANAHADELAFHFSRAGASRLAPKAARYLMNAGRSALARYANQEAAGYLGAALELTDLDGGADPDESLITDLARARQRIGDFASAIELWQRIHDAASASGDPARLAAAEHRLGLARFWSGDAGRALAHYDAGLAAAEQAGDPGPRARLHIARAEALLEQGRPDDTALALGNALRCAEQTDDLALLSRVHRGLLLLHTWTGPPDKAREHGARLLALAERTGDRALACTAHWSLAAMEGLTGNLDAMAVHIGHSERYAEEIKSPLHRIWVTELCVEHLSATGQWDAALAVGERGIAQARAFHQRAPLTRLLVWTANLYLARGDFEQGKRYVDEAWELSGAADPARAQDVNLVVPAHIGRVAYHLWTGDFEEAVRIGEAGLAIADRSGYTVWAIHRLVPMIGEAYLYQRDLESATRLGARLRRDSERMGHTAGLAWADTCDAILDWLRGDTEKAIETLRRAADHLDAIQLIPDAARLRRQYAGRLADRGDHEEALRQLRQVHDVFLRLGARPELQRARDQFRELGARPPSRESAAAGVAGLTPREVEIVRLVSSRKSNKAIGQTLDISARTVSTHLSSIFRKLNVSSRGELAEVARTLPLPE
jgi:DNA-binding CsgD family transcriptional regulator